MRGTLTISAVCAALTISMAAATWADNDKGKGKSKGKGHDKGAPVAEVERGRGDRDVVLVFNDRDRDAVRRYCVDTVRRGTCPSGLATQHNCLRPILASFVGFAVLLSTPLGTAPGGEYAHSSRTLGGRRVAFVGAWLKIISYLGALAFLALGFADYVAELLPAAARGASVRTAVALGALVLFFGVHAAGVRWFGRLQLAMVALLGFSVAVLVVPRLFAI